MTKKIFLINTLLILMLTPIYETYSQKFKADQIYDLFKESVVVVISYGFDGKAISQGSGVIISDSGYVVTNYHNFQNAEKIVISINGKKYQGDEIVGADIIRDILIIKLNGNNFHAIKKADLKNIKVGQKIYTIGTPMGLVNTLSEGIISRIGYTPQLNRNLIQITAPITHGSSGGAVLTEEGLLVGISSYGLGEANLNFAIPIEELENINIIPYSNKKSLKLINYYYRGLNAGISQNYLESIKYLKECIKIDPTQSTYFYNLGLSYENLAKFDSAINYYKKAININSQDAKAFCQIGRINYYLQKYSEAEKYILESIKIDSTFSNAFDNLACVYLQQEKYQDAINYSQKAISLNKYNYSAYNTLAILYKRDKKFDVAVDLLAEALKYNPNWDMAYFNLASVYADQSDNLKAIENYLKVIKINENYYKAYFQLASTYYNLGDYNNALLYLNKIQNLYKNKKIDPKEISLQELNGIYNLSGLSEYKKGNSNDAIKNFKIAINYDSTVSAPFTNLALVYIDKKDTNSVLFYTQKAVTIDSSLWKYYQYNGDIYFKQNKYEDAINNYLHYNLYDSVNVNLLFKLSVSYVETRQTENSIKILIKILNIDSLKFEALNLYAVLLSEKKEYDIALNYFLKALEIDKQNPGVLYNIGLAFYNKKNYDLGKQYFIKAAQSGHVKAQDWLNQNKIKY